MLTDTKAVLRPLNSVHERGRYFSPPPPAGSSMGNGFYESGNVHGMFEDFDDIQLRLNDCRQEHRDLDSLIDAARANPVTDILGMQRLKKRKLMLKDEISKLEAMLIPDIIA